MVQRARSFQKVETKWLILNLHVSQYWKQQTQYSPRREQQTQYHSNKNSCYKLSDLMNNYKSRKGRINDRNSRHSHIKEKRAENYDQSECDQV